MKEPEAIRKVKTGVSPALIANMSFDSSSMSSSDSGSKYIMENDDNYVYNYPAQPTGLYYPRGTVPGTNQFGFNDKYLYGEALCFAHRVVLRTEKLPSKNPRDLRVRSNNQKTVVSNNHESYDYICKLDGGRFL